MTMPRFENRDKDGTLIETFVVSDETLKADPDAILKSRGPLKSRAPAAPDGYDFIATVEGDPDALVSDVVVHYYAKHKSYEKEKPSKLSGLKALVAEAEVKKETVEGTPAK
jgi:hypothetical protein